MQTFALIPIQGFIPNSLPTTPSTITIPANIQSTPAASLHEHQSTIEAKSKLFLTEFAEQLNSLMLCTTSFAGTLSKMGGHSG